MVDGQYCQSMYVFEWPGILQLEPFFPSEFGYSLLIHEKTKVKPKIARQRLCSEPFSLLLVSLIFVLIITFLRN